MNDRFKFRVWITAPITRDVEEEKEVSFYIYDIALYDDGGVGFSRDSLLDALDKLNLTEGQCKEIEDYISDNSYSEDWEWYAISFDVIEQCTGLKDKNGNLIYDGDYIRSVNQDTKDRPDLQVGHIWVDEMGCRWIKFKTEELSWNDFCSLIDYDATLEIEVIGNEHEERNFEQI